MSNAKRLASLCLVAVVAVAHASEPRATCFKDMAFGGSFWYPADWKVTAEPVGESTQHGWFRDGRIVRSFQVQPASSHGKDQPPGILVQEVLATNGLTELGGCASASPVGYDQRFFFDPLTRRWMQTRLTDKPTTGPAPLEGMTMGGLPVLPGAARGGTEMIVPLDATHFLVVSDMDSGGEQNFSSLAQTVTATSRKAAKQATAHVRAKTIRREVEQLGKML